MYTVSESFAMSWGKIRRAFLVAFRKRRVLEKLDRRKGACHRCGACCKLLFQCPAFDDSDGSPKCLIYNDRPGVCGLFPLDEADLRERDAVMPGKKCGFYFEDAPETGVSRAGELREAMPNPVRWGPRRSPGLSRRLRIRGIMAILLACFRRPQTDEPDESQATPEPPPAK
jgi:hypothetical protein